MLVMHYSTFANYQHLKMLYLYFWVGRCSSYIGISLVILYHVYKKKKKWEFAWIFFDKMTSLGMRQHKRRVVGRFVWSIKQHECKGLICLVTVRVEITLLLLNAHSSYHPITSAFKHNHQSMWVHEHPTACMIT